MSLAQGWKIFFSHPSGTQKGVKVIKPFYNLYIIFWTKKRNYPVKQQAHAKSLAVWLSTFFILVWPVWLQFGHCTVVGYLVRYMPFVVAPGKNPSKKRQIEWYFVTKIVLTYCEKKIVLVIEKNFWRPRICKIFEITRTIYSNSESSEQFSVTECFFNLFLEVSHI